jgi:hypothetical protein
MSTNHIDRRRGVNRHVEGGPHGSMIPRLDVPSWYLAPRAPSPRTGVAGRTRGRSPRGGTESGATDSPIMFLAKKEGSKKVLDVIFEARAFWDGVSRERLSAGATLTWEPRSRVTLTETMDQCVRVGPGAVLRLENRLRKIGYGDFTFLVQSALRFRSPPRGNSPRCL